MGIWLIIADVLLPRKSCLTLILSAASSLPFVQKSHAIILESMVYSIL